MIQNGKRCKNKSARQKRRAQKAVNVPLEPRRHFTAEKKSGVRQNYGRGYRAGVAPGFGGAEETEFCKEFSEMLAAVTPTR